MFAFVLGIYIPQLLFLDKTYVEPSSSDLAVACVISYSFICEILPFIFAL